MGSSFTYHEVEVFIQRGDPAQTDDSAGPGNARGKGQPATGNLGSREPIWSCEFDECSTKSRCISNLHDDRR
jgi:hypothetical protein